MLNILLLVISFTIVILAIIGKKTENISKRKTVVMLVCAILTLTLSASFRIINTGYTGVKTTFGQIDTKVLHSGFNLKIPFVQSIRKVNNKQQDKVFKDEIWGEASDKTVVFAKGVIVTYQINPEKSAYICANVNDYKDTLIPQTLVNSAVKSAMIQLPSEQVTNRAKIEALTKTTLEKSIIEKYNSDAVFILKITIDNMDFEESYNKAIADKQIARQNAERQAM